MDGTNNYIGLKKEIGLRNCRYENMCGNSISSPISIIKKSFVRMLGVVFVEKLIGLWLDFRNKVGRETGSVYH